MQRTVGRRAQGDPHHAPLPCHAVRAIRDAPPCHEVKGVGVRHALVRVKVRVRAGVGVRVRVGVGARVRVGVGARVRVRVRVRVRWGRGWG